MASNDIPGELDIPDGLHFGPSPCSWRFGLSGNRQFVFLVLRNPTAVFCASLEQAGARTLSAQLAQWAEEATGANTPADQLIKPPTPKDLLIPTLDADAIRRDLNGRQQ